MEFEYKAVSRGGQKTSGVVEAASQVALARDLREKELFLVWAKERGGGGSGRIRGSVSLVAMLKKAGASFEMLLKQVTLEDKVLFARHLSLMVRAGFSLNKALDTLARQTPNGYFADVIKDLSQKVASGKSFHEALTAYPRIFSPLFMSMIKVGEAAGQLEETLTLATLHLRRERALKKKILGAMVYPAVVIAAMMGVGAIMMIFVLPQLATTFAELDVKLPLSTRVIFGLAGFLSRFWYLSLAIAAVAAYAVYFLTRRTAAGRKAVNLMFLKTPIFADLTKKLNSARFSRTLASLLSGGVSLTEAISITSDTLTNFYYKKTVLETLPEIEKGKTLSSLLKNRPDLFPPMVTEMLAVGEETGSMVTVLKELARFFEGEVAAATKSLSSIVEPVVMVVIGLAVGVFALSVIQPIYSIGAGIQ